MWTAQSGYCEPPTGGKSLVKQMELVKLLIFTFLVLDVLPDHLFIHPDSRNIIAARPGKPINSGALGSSLSSRVER
jgi:hypothetical protein